MFYFFKGKIMIAIDSLPHGNKPSPLEFSYFPTLHQTVIWRNWNMVTTSRLAEVLKTTEEKILTAAAEMGISKNISSDQEHLWLERGYISIIRQNWHLLPYSQILELLGWNAEEMRYALKEDDFLWNKLGGLKPDAKEVIFRELTDDEKKKTAELKSYVSNNFKDINNPAVEKPFEFLDRFKHPKKDWKPSDKKSSFDLRLAYSYFAVYGDPLINEELDPYPEGLLAELAENGINAVWLQGILYTLVPWLGENKYSRGHETRIKNLNKLVEKAAKYGIGVYLYLNEPRAMLAEFFEENPELCKGTVNTNTGDACICTLQPGFLEKFKNAVKELYTKVPSLAGAFTITVSENMTHCHSHSMRANTEVCPVCGKHSVGELIAKVNNAIEEGMHEANSSAQMIAWSWAWVPKELDPDNYVNCEEALDFYNEDINVMCTQENYVDTEALGVKGVVADYSMSKIGPAKYARHLWGCSAKRNLKTIAKIQLNNTWECSAVPYLPVPTLVKQTLENIENLGVSGLMVAWTLGGYPGGNLLLVDKSVEELAEERFGKNLVPGIIKAWEHFADGFKEFPLNGSAALYTAPQNYGPMNLLYAEKSGYKATMVGFPYDDLLKWRGSGHFPEEIFEEKFRLLSEGWKKGLDVLKSLSDKVTEDIKENFDDLVNVSEAAYCHFRSTYLQIRFIRLRDSGNRSSHIDDMVNVINEEIELAGRLLEVMRKDSRIGFEASNHYYYSENTLYEKILNCEYVKDLITRNKK